MEREEQAMRFLAALAKSRPGGEIKLHRADLDTIKDGDGIDCFSDGPVVVVRFREKAKVESSDKGITK